LSDAAKQGDIDLGIVGAHVDAAVAQDQADLVERDATAQHLRGRRVPQQMGALQRSLHAGTLQGVPDHRRNAVAVGKRDGRCPAAKEDVIRIAAGRAARKIGEQRVADFLGQGSPTS
jgi:hypothetical protein